jgi:hypothetical protein
VCSSDLDLAYTDLTKESKTIQEPKEGDGPEETAKKIFVQPEELVVDDLTQLVKVGDFVVVDRLNEVEGVIKGGWLSILNISE